MIHSEISRLEAIGVPKSVIDGADVLILPTLSIERLQESEDTVDSIALFKFIKRSLNTKNSLDLNLKLKASESRGDDLWLGAVWVLNTLAVPVVVNLVSTWISNRVGEREKQETRKGTIRLELGVSQPDGSVSKLSYQGDSTTLLKLLKPLSEKRNDG